MPATGHPRLFVATRDDAASDAHRRHRSTRSIETETLTDDQHKRSNKTRKNQIRRHLASEARRRTPEDHKRLKERSRRRKAERDKAGPRRRDWTGMDEDDAHLFVEPMGPRGGDRAEPASTASRDRDADGPDAAAITGDPSAVGLPTARVVSLGAGFATLSTSAGELEEATLSEPLARTQQTSLAVGDIVHVEDRADGPWVVAVAPRRTTLSRPDPGNARRRRVLAANIDVAVLVLSVTRPRFKPGLVDRFLIALEHGGARPVVVANKLDLLESADERAAIDERLAPYPGLGVPVIATSASSGEGLADLRAAIAGHTAVFVGHSGVGKSSLLNGLDPRHRRRVHAGRGGDGKGRHTTTRSTLVELPDGGAVIDTPGVRAFGLWGLTTEELRAAFPDLAEVAAGCRFRDCSHRVEPDCAVRDAAESGALPRARLQSYLRILESLEG